LAKKGKWVRLRPEVSRTERTLEDLRAGKEKKMGKKKINEGERFGERKGGVANKLELTDKWTEREKEKS